MKAIMLGTDFSERSDRALRRATLLARQFKTRLSVIHAVDDDQPKRIVDSEHDIASALLRELQHTVRTVDGVDCVTRVVLADPFAGLARAAAEEAPDMLVIGPHRRRVLGDVFVGTTAERTIHSVTCPVLMANAPPVGPYRHVMLSTDLSEGAGHAAKVCAGLNIACGAELSILHVFDAPALHLAMSHTMKADGRDAYIAGQRKRAVKGLAEFVVSHGRSSMRQHVRYGEQPPSMEILAAATEAAADLIVVGTHGRSGVAKFALGSVAEAVLRKADRDVLAVPPAAAA